MDFIIVFLVFILSIVVTVNLTKSLPNGLKKSGKILFFMHTLTTIAYYFFIKKNGGDAYRYWSVGSSLNFDQAIELLLNSKGTYFMEAFNYFFSGFLGIGFFANSCIYGLLGYIGIILFYKVAVNYNHYKMKILGINVFPFIFYIPMLHFWSSGIGKDTLLMLCIGAVFYASIEIKRRLILFIFGLFFSFLIRPHITLMLLMAYGMAFIISKEQALSKRIFLGLILLVTGLAVLPSVLQFANIGEASVESFNNFSSSKADALNRTSSGSGVDISGYPLPLKWLTFLFRPFFFDINGIPALIASFENLFIVILTLKIIKLKPLKTLKKAPLVIKASFFFLVLGILAFSPTLGNLGIMIRMRNMFLPGMFLFYLYVINFYQKERYLKVHLQNKTYVN